MVHHTGTRCRILIGPKTGHTGSLPNDDQTSGRGHRSRYGRVRVLTFHRESLGEIEAMTLKNVTSAAAQIGAGFPPSTAGVHWPHVPPPTCFRPWRHPLEQLKSAAPGLLGEQDWTRARAFLHARLRQLLDRCDEAVVEDATQEAAIRLLRVIRRESVRNHEALMNDICRKTAIDTMRWNQRCRQTFESIDESPVERPVSDSVDPLARMEFVVLEFFRGRHAACYELAVAYFNDRDWEQVAEAVGKSHAAIRKRWSRCVAVLRSVARRSPDFLSAWAHR